VVIDKKWTHGGSKYNAVRDLYTLTQRSRRGSVIVDRGMKNLLGLDNISRVTAKQNIAINIISSRLCFVILSPLIILYHK
jgi:hypothetical protein